MLRIRIGSSAVLAALLAVIHAAAAACVLSYTAKTWSVVLMSGLIASLVFHLRRDAWLRAGDSVVEIALHDDGRCELGTRDSGSLEARVLGSTFVSPLLIVLNVRLDRGKVRSVTLMPDSAAAEDRRRLRVWLRYRARPDTPARSDTA